MDPIRIGFLGFDGITALDLVGPIEAFAAVAIDEGEGPLRRCYEVWIIGLTRKPFQAESGLVIAPHYTIEDAPEVDTLIVPGGRGLRQYETNATVSAWLKSQAGRVRRMASVCTGITPAAFVECLRLDEARCRLTTANSTIEQVATSVGFQSADAFRRAFERRFGVAPGAYRNRFEFESATVTHKPKGVSE